MDKLLSALSQLQKHLPNMERKKEAVSQACVGWHVQHSLLVLSSVVNALKLSDPSSYKPRFSYGKAFVFLFGKIPRGRIKAPRSVQPGDTVSIDLLTHHLERMKESISSLDELPGNAFFIHPFFGHVNLKAAKKFMAIHTGHHLKIIDDILK
jgi:hypothetical protein